jgi:AcrR family transcriptional regulator
VQESAAADGRHERSRRTRLKIVTAATELFVIRGYGATSITAIAARADIAVQTVYATFGTKHAILAAALDQAIAGDDAPVAVNARDWMLDVFEAPTAAERLTAYARSVRRINANAGALFTVVASAATVDTEVIELADITEARRRLGARSVIDSILTVSALRRGLDVERATDVLSMLNSPATFQHLVRRNSWSLDDYQQWLADAMVRELLPTTRRART